jgi:frataxin
VVFNRIAEASILGFQEQIEKAADSQAVDVDVDYSDSVLKIRIGSIGTFVLNKQPPIRELWYSSPLSGPAHYVHDPERGWWCKRDGHKLLDLLQKEMSQALGAPVSMHIEPPE